MDQKKENKLKSLREKYLQNINQALEESYSGKRDKYIMRNFEHLIELDESGTLEKMYIEALKTLISDMENIISEFKQKVKQKS